MAYHKEIRRKRNAMGIKIVGLHPREHGESLLGTVNRSVSW